MFILVDNARNEFKDKIWAIWDEEADAVGYSLRHPNYQAEGFEIYLLNAERGIKRVSPWKDHSQEWSEG
jgi:hypothetical protein